MQENEEQTPLEVVREEISRAKGLLENPNWTWLFDQAQSDVQGILNGIVSTPRIEITQDLVYSWVFQLGEMSGILRHFDKPKYMLKVAQEEYDRLIAESKDEGEEDARSRNPGDASP